jgi:DNA processing protein
MTKRASSDLPYYLAFTRVRGVGPARTKLLQTYFKSLGAAWHASLGELVASGLDAKTASSIQSARQTISPDDELASIEKLNIRAITWDDDEYPPLLREVSEAPPVLFVRGQLTNADNLALAIVGTRNATTYGREVTEFLVANLVKQGITIVSGLARGIDGVAHQTALANGGRTVAVLGSGVDVIYPPEHRKLAAQIIEQGAIISDYAPGTEPEAMNFPPRNRIISGMSLGVIVVEADEKSGSLITTQFALEQGRDVFSVPGNIFNRTSAGTNNLLKNGAKVVTSVEDILEELNLALVAAHQDAQQLLPIPENDIEQKILDALSFDPTPTDELVRTLALPTAQITTALTMMELKGMVRQAGGNSYALARG